MVLGAFVAVGQCLTCRQCPIGVFGTCLFPKDVTCDNSTLNCFTGEAQFNATGAFTLHLRGCLDSDLCGRTLTGSLLGAGYTSRFSCCQTELCNGAGSVQLSLGAALSAAFLASLWGGLHPWNPLKDPWNPVKDPWNTLKDPLNPIKDPWSPLKYPWNPVKDPWKWNPIKDPLEPPQKPLEPS
ncbi:uncharacterized protein ACN63O_017734 [Diretmus argenteus]